MKPGRATQTNRPLLAAVSDAGLMALIRMAGQSLGVRVEAAPAVRLAELAPAALQAAALVVEIDPGIAGALEDFHRLARCLPERKIVAAARSASGEDVRRLFRTGAADVLTEPFAETLLAASLAEVLRTQETGAGTRGRVISVLKACGGAGATTIALNLAALSAQGDPKRDRPRRATAVLDLDLQFGDADVALDLQPKSGLVDVLRAPERVDARFLQSVMTDHSSGLKLLAPAPGVLPMDALNAEVAAGLVDLAAAAFERTVIDLPAAWTDWTLQVLAHSDAIVLASVPTVAGALSARRVLDALAEAQVAPPVFFVLNRLNGLIETVDRPARIGKSLDLAVDAALPFDPVAAKAADRGRLVTEAFSASRLAKALRTAAARLDERLERLAATTAPVETAA